MFIDGFDAICDYLTKQRSPRRRGRYYGRRRRLEGERWNIFSGLEKIVETKHPLAKETWYGLGGPADYFIRPENIEQLVQVVKRCNENKVPIYVLGYGSNLLVSDEGVRGAVIQLKSDNFSQMKFDKEQVISGRGRRA